MSGVGGGLFGRAGELAEARAFLDLAARGPAALAVEGAPGIGKTSVWRAVLDEARGRGFRTLSCTGDQAETRLSLAAVADLLDDVRDDELSHLPEPQREALYRALLRHEVTSDATTGTRRLGSGLRSLLVGLASSAPVVVAVDDAQWLDAASAGALAFAVRRLRPHRVGVLVAVRPSSSDDPLGLQRALDDDELTRLRLGPLTADDLRATIASRLRYEYPEPVMARVAAVTDGNPLFALEVARALGATPRWSPYGRLPVPDSLREVVRARVETLGNAGRQALLAAAALGRPSVDVVERAASANGLAEAEEAGLVHVDGARVVFAHPLYASAVYDAASARRRRATHLGLAGLLADGEERARHLALGTAPPDARVADALDLGAAQARARGAWDAAAELLELARTFTPEQDARARQERSVRAAENHMHAAARARASRLLEEVLAGTATRALRCEALRLLAEIYNNDTGVEATQACLEEALAVADTPAERVTIQLQLADLHSGGDDFTASCRHADVALHEAESLGDPALVAEALAMRAAAGFLNGEGIDGAAVERSLALEDHARVIPLFMRPRSLVALLELSDDRLDVARERLTELCREASDAGDESDLASILCYLCELEAKAGDFSAAIAVGEAAVQNAALTGSPASRCWALAALTLAHAGRGDVDETRSLAAEAVAAGEPLGLWGPLIWVWTGLGLLELSLGDPAAAWEATRPATEQVERAPIREPAVHDYLPTALEALVQLGELDRAERLIDRLEERARAVERRSWVAHAVRARALLLAERGELEAADAALSASLDEYERLDLRLEAARALLALGRVRRRRRQRLGARDALERALASFESLGAAQWSERTREELARLPHAAARNHLTTTERRVVSLAAAGLSNKEIARTLFVTVSTVEVHLSHSYAKLGVRSRAGLAAAIRDEEVDTTSPASS